MENLPKTFGYKKLIIYQKAKELVLLIYNSIQENHVREHMDELNADMSSSKTKGNPDRKVVGGRHKITSNFPKSETYSLVPQMRRAVVSVLANIVEGYAKDSSKEYARFLTISIGSLTELEVYLEISLDLNFLTGTEFNIANSLLIEVKKLLYTSRRTVRARAGR